jgi:putative tricarboxylic transport membrane protein
LAKLKLFKTVSNFVRDYDCLGGLIWLAVGIFFCIGSIKYKLGNFKVPGPGFMPFIAWGLLGLFGLVLILSSKRKLESDEEEKDGGMWAGHNWKRVIFTLMALFCYGIILEYLGFLTTTFLFLLFLFKLTEPRKWIMPLLMSGVTVILSYLVFALWLKSSFPKGILGF